MADRTSQIIPRPLSSIKTPNPKAEAVTVNAIQFDNANTHAIAGTGSLTLETNSLTTPPTMNAAQGSHQFQANVNLRNDTTVNIGSGASLEFVNRLNLNGNTLTMTGVGTLLVNNSFNTGSGTILNNGGVLEGGGTIGGSVDNSGGTVAPGNNPKGDSTGQVPEPTALFLLALGVSGVAVATRQRTPNLESR